nr:MAG: hypothetical protein [Bacteriophage sp.]
MTIQQDATTRQQEPISKQQIADENHAAEVAQGFTVDQPGASDNLNTDTRSPEQKAKDVADQVREQQQAQANDREDLMSDIAAKRRAHMAGQAEDMPEDDGFDESVDILNENQENQSQENETQVAPEAQAAQDVQPPADTGPRFFTDANGQQQCELLVNGVKRVVPAERVLAAAQKLEAGDERLRQAAEERTRLEQDRLRWIQEQRAAQQVSQPSVDPDAAAKQKALLRERVEKLLNEGDESSIDGLVEVLYEGRQAAIPQINPHQIAQEAVIIANRNAWDNQLISDSQTFETDPEFADINGNDILGQKAAEYAKQLTRERNARDLNIRPLDIMRQAANMARDEARQLAAALGVTIPQASSQTQQTSREAATEARKQQLGNTVTGGAAPRPTVEGERKAAPDGGRNPSSMDSKAAAFAGLNAVRTQPALKR